MHPLILAAASGMPSKLPSDWIGWAIVIAILVVVVRGLLKLLRII